MSNVLITPDPLAAEGLFLGDCRDLLRADLADDSIDACVTDPPYGIGFMGREWDTFTPGTEQRHVLPNRSIDSANPNLKGRSRAPAASPSAVEYDRTLAGQRLFQEWTTSWAAEVYRVLKPGGHLVVFGAPRSHHRMMSGLEDAGFEIRDCAMWLFGQGFPKSKNLGSGWGTALKPAWEPIAIARKPVVGTVTANVAAWGTGGINIDGCRIEGEVTSNPLVRNAGGYEGGLANQGATGAGTHSFGRWPANLLLDESAAAILDAEVGELKSGAQSTAYQRSAPQNRHTYGAGAGPGAVAFGVNVPANSGGPSRFFYCPKVSTWEREFGCGHLPLRTPGDMTGGRAEGSAGLNNPRAGAGRTSGSHNAHPTVKPIALMRWLVKLVTPPDGIVLDPFVGSGSTAIAADLEGFGFYGSDLEIEWLTVAHARVLAWRARGGGDAD